MKQISEIQEERQAWVRENFPPHNNPDRDLMECALGVAEEAGELSHHVLKMVQGIRGSQEDHEEGIRDAVGDIVIFLMGVCDNLERITDEDQDLDVIVDEVWGRVRDRDWKSNPQDGRVDDLSVHYGVWDFASGRFLTVNGAAISFPTKELAQELIRSHHPKTRATLSAKPLTEQGSRATQG